MNKPKGFLRSIVSVTAVFAVFSFVFVFAFGANAASTIGTNMSTTGTLTVTPATDSATSVRFQNAAGTNFFIVDSVKSRIGVGSSAPATVFEVQGTASASYFITENTIQVGGLASVAYSRFGTNATTASAISTTNDLLISGNLEVDLKSYFDAPAEFQGTASASYFLTQNTIQVGGAFATVAYSRFGSGTTGNTGEFASADDLLITGSLEIDGKASLASNFQMSGKF